MFPTVILEHAPRDRFFQSIERTLVFNAASAATKRIVTPDARNIAAMLICVRVPRQTEKLE